jgi:hypothetical protein
MDLPATAKGAASLTLRVAATRPRYAQLTLAACGPPAYLFFSGGKRPQSHPNG